MKQGEVVENKEQLGLAGEFKTFVNTLVSQVEENEVVEPSRQSINNDLNEVKNKDLIEVQDSSPQTQSNHAIFLDPLEQAKANIEQYK